MVSGTPLILSVIRLREACLGARSIQLVYLYGHVMRREVIHVYITRRTLRMPCSNGNKTQRTPKDNVGNVKTVDTTTVEAGNVTVSNK